MCSPSYNDVNAYISVRIVQVPNTYLMSLVKCLIFILKNSLKKQSNHFNCKSSSLSLQDILDHFRRAFKSSLNFSKSHHKHSLFTKQSAHKASVLTFGSFAAYLTWKHCVPIAQCRAAHNSRLSHENEEDLDNTSQPKFQWKSFLQLLWEDIFYLLGAILVIMQLKNLYNCNFLIKQIIKYI